MGHDPFVAYVIGLGLGLAWGYLAGLARRTERAALKDTRATLYRRPPSMAEIAGYRCPVCGAGGLHFQACQRPDCADGRL